MTEPTSHLQSTSKPGAGLATIVVVAVVGFMVLTHVLAIGPTYAGLLFFWYWGAIGQARLAALPAMLIGALVGVAIAWSLQLATLAHNGPMLVAVLAVIIGAIYIQIMEILPIAINISTMLFLTVAAAPLLQHGENMKLFALAIILSALYFGAIVFGLSRISSRRDAALPIVPDPGSP